MATKRARKDSNNFNDKRTQGFRAGGALALLMSSARSAEPPNRNTDKTMDEQAVSCYYCTERLACRECEVCEYSVCNVCSVCSERCLNCR
ncbi:HDL428Wp [Eremothecium sinecaudum]|uniref:HDL428Wp n=1 Tax=Eremothecium sinecaudum TaxID=45286 RepID=A0A0X8HRX2_9SACH|nr:HDL428Wp [Eremothecium sinecaudum]AMD20316.1 HDL428Wp [Eremothecium sinecaudum]